jgi:hypothetical protein
MRSSNVFRPGWVAAAAVLLAGATPALAQSTGTTTPSRPPNLGTWSSGNTQGGSSTGTGITMPRAPNLGVWSSGTTTGGTGTFSGSSRAPNLGTWSSNGMTGGTGLGGGFAGTNGGTGFGGSGGWGGGGGFGGGFGGLGSGMLDLAFSGLLSPDQEMMVLMDAITTADSLISDLGLQFNNPFELLYFVLMIYEVKYEQAVLALLNGGTGGTTGGTGGTTTPVIGGTGGTGGTTTGGIGGTTGTGTSNAARTSGRQ